MKHKLKLKYTEVELKELKKLSEYYHNTPILALWQAAGVEDCNGLFKGLRAKFIAIEHEDEFDFMADINNVVMGTAIFPEKKYVVHDKFTDRYVCFNTLTESFCWSQLRIPAEKTNEEWLYMNPAYEAMLEEVEDDKVEEENE